MHMWQTIRQSSVGRHVHTEAYVSIVLSGGYEEAGDYGRIHAGVGNAIFHERFEAHLNRFTATGAAVLNLRLPKSTTWKRGLATVQDVDQIVSVAERDRADALNLVFSAARPVEVKYPDWPDMLAAHLAHIPNLRLSEWAEQNSLSPWTISRNFKRVFGTTPEAFRARARARSAWIRIEKTDEPLAGIAADLCFTDQSHMTHSVKALTGFSPRAWRGPCKG